MRPPPKAWKKKVKRNLKKRIRMTDKTAEVTVNDIWKHGMKAKCRVAVIKKYGNK